MARRTLGNIPVEEANVSSGGDLPVVVADPTTPANKLAVDASGRLTLASIAGATARTPADNQALVLALVVEAVLKGYDGLNADLLRTALGSGASLGAGGLAVVPHLWSATDSFTPLYVPADALANPNIQPVAEELFNNTTFDRRRNNTEGTLLASAARTASTTSPTQVNYNARGVIVYLNVTAASGTGGLTLNIRSLDPISGNTIDLNTAPTAIIATGRYGYELGPGASTAGVAGNGSMNQRTAGQLPRTWVVLVSHADASSYTYSVGYALIL